MATSSDSTGTVTGSPNHRSVYLITYSQATEEWTRQSFADVVVSEFESGDATVLQWACSEESHEDGGRHFHMAIKLDRQKRWLRVRQRIMRVYGINLNFSNDHAQYFNAWQYVTKEDIDYLESDRHPDLSAGFVPRTATASNARRSTASSLPVEGAPINKRRRFDSLDLADVIIARNIKTKKDLLKIANEQRRQGKRDLPLYILNNIERCVKLISTTWEMENVRAEEERESKTRIQILRECLEKECVPGCEGLWLRLALQTLQRNGIGVGVFSSAVLNSLQLGRGKHRNILIVGTGNCAKSFLLTPLEKVYRCFTNPAHNNFAWTGAESAEVIFLNDIRYSDKLIPWSNFLQLLEGAEVRLSAPKNHCPEDIRFTKDTPIFATSIGPIRKYIAGVVDEGETEMMALRWKVFKFTYKILQEDVIAAEPCPHCFATLIFNF